MFLLTPRGFLLYGGVLWMCIGFLGYLGVLGPVPDKSFFGEWLWFDQIETISLLLFGCIAFTSGFFLKDEKLDRDLTIAFGILSCFIGMYTLYGEIPLVGAALQRPADALFNTAIGIWALTASLLHHQKSKKR